MALGQDRAGSGFDDRGPPAPQPSGPPAPQPSDPQALVPASPVAGTQLPALVPTTTAPPSGPVVAQGLTPSGIPTRVLLAYVTAAQTTATQDPQCKISWSLLAGIGRVESNHARFRGAGVTADGRVSPAIYGPLLDGNGFPAIRDTDGGRLDGNVAYDRAVGPMQFIPGTWAAYGADSNGDGAADPQSVDDAALGAARYLCAAGGDLSTQTDRWNAVFRYNRSSSYVALVLALADSYATGTPTAIPPSPPGVDTDSPGPPASGGDPPAPPPPAPASSAATSPSPTTDPTGSPAGSPTTDPAPLVSPTADPTGSPTAPLPADTRSGSVAGTG